MKQRDPDENGWLSSSQAWIDRMPDSGDFAREFVLDKPMLERSELSGAAKMLDIGCGEGRFCRMAKRIGIDAIGVDPIEPFIERARKLDPSGKYLNAFAEKLPFGDEEFDLAVFYLTLLDIDDIHMAIREATRVLKPDGRILIANLTSFFTSNGTIGWIKGEDGRVYHPLGNYFRERSEWFEWDGLRVRNWHRPLSTYMSVLLGEGLKLTFFDEPRPSSGPQDRVERYLTTPFTMIMEWQKC